MTKISSKFRKLSSDYRIQIAFLVLSFLIVYIDAYIFMKTGHVLLPILNGIIVALQIIVFKGKFRIYILVFYIPVTKFLTLPNTSIGSFLTWIVVLYFLIVIFENIYEKSFTKGDYVFLIQYALLLSFILLINIINLNASSFKKIASYSFYLFLPFLFVIDKKGHKDLSNLSFAFALGHLFSNLFSIFVIYALKDGKAFFSTFVPEYLRYFEAQQSSSFRYPGLKGDSNHNSLYCLLSLVLLILCNSKSKTIKKISAVVLGITLQFFALFGGSKTYILALAASSILVFAFLCAKKKIPIVVLPVVALLVATIVPLILNNELLYKPISRFMFIDDRAGFLSAITTNRSDIWSEYLSRIADNPLFFIIGHGTETYVGFNYHNMYIQILWEYGFAGLLFIPFVFRRFFIKREKINVLNLLPLFLVLFYAMSLHILYDEGLLGGLFLNYLVINNYTNQIREDGYYEILI